MRWLTKGWKDYILQYPEQVQLGLMLFLMIIRHLKYKNQRLIKGRYFLKTYEFQKYFHWIVEYNISFIVV
jgi:hypothetical protein